jgi:hypothetical protein
MRCVQASDPGAAIASASAGWAEPERMSAGLEGIALHNLRRSFIANARRRGVPESVAMWLSVHRNLERRLNARPATGRARHRRGRRLDGRVRASGSADGRSPPGP